MLLLLASIHDTNLKQDSVLGFCWIVTHMSIAPVVCIIAGIILNHYATNILGSEYNQRIKPMQDRLLILRDLQRTPHFKICSTCLGWLNRTLIAQCHFSRVVANDLCSASFFEITAMIYKVTSAAMWHHAKHVLWYCWEQEELKLG